MKDFFISYNKNDRSWAEWIAWNLEEAGYSTVLQAWDFRPGSNFVQRMQQAAIESTRTIAVLSPDYLSALFTHSEWQAAFHQDPTGEKGVLVPVRVRVSELKGLLSQIIFIDLVNLDEERAKAALFEGLDRSRAKPTTAPTFPGVMDHTVEKPSTYPGYEISARITTSSMPQTEKILRKCKPFSVQLAVFSPERNMRVQFALDKACNPDDSAFYSFLFVLSQKIGAEFQERIRVSVTIGANMTDRAEKLVKEGLSESQVTYLSGPVTARAKKLPVGTERDPKLDKLITGVFSH